MIPIQRDIAGLIILIGLLIVAAPARSAGKTTRVHAPATPQASRTELPTFATPWLPPSQRRSVTELDTEMRTQAGEAVNLARSSGMPSALAFFYTRCGNPARCARTVEAMATLRRLLDRSGWGQRVRCLLITFDPERDSVEELKRFGESRSLALGPRMLLLRAEPQRLQRVIDGLEVPVNFNADRVNTHGLALFLLDSQGRLVRKYHTLIWDNNRVISDLKRLVDEAPG
jgi:cytochrome oxidase Cu insertion factor (SCO1/SenC/PrrC family)